MADDPQISALPDCDTGMGIPHVLDIAPDTSALVNMER